MQHNILWTCIAILLAGINVKMTKIVKVLKRVEILYIQSRDTSNLWWKTTERFQITSPQNKLVTYKEWIAELVSKKKASKEIEAHKRRKPVLALKHTEVWRSSEPRSLLFYEKIDGRLTTDVAD